MSQLKSLCSSTGATGKASGGVVEAVRSWGNPSVPLHIPPVSHLQDFANR